MGEDKKFRTTFMAWNMNQYKEERTLMEAGKSKVRYHRWGAQNILVGGRSALGKEPCPPPWRSLRFNSFQRIKRTNAEDAKENFEKSSLRPSRFNSLEKSLLDDRLNSLQELLWREIPDHAGGKDLLTILVEEDDGRHAGDHEPLPKGFRFG